ncbi:N,N-dimethylformamidase beta subunit family domain-containing protein [Pseudarthrobacter sp. NPDC092424]|uniref:N,N-dimethylformamidase beta subunit family domain-containing protein n=1 Tax=Pseudarthrobacter sp. NPDC092424 TaxID=3364415 RepID=UPI003808227F
MKWKTFLASLVVVLGTGVTPAQAGAGNVPVPAGVSVTPNVSVTASNPTAYATTTLAYRATITSAGTLTAVQFAVPPGSGGKVTSVNGTLSTYAPGYLRWTPTRPIPVSVGSRLSIPVYNLRLPKAATYRLGMNAVERTRYLTAGYGSLTVNPVPPAPMEALPAKPWPEPGPGCPSVWAPIARENALAGTSAWAITAQSTSMSMWADKQSAACGESVGLHIQSSRPVTVTAYRMGFYAGLGGRKVWTSEIIPASSQPGPAVLDNNVSASSWTETLSVPITTEFRPGVYLLRAEDAAGEATYAPLTVRDDTPVRHDLLIQQATSTWQAYNRWGGYSFYTSNAGSSTLSYDRPYDEGFGAGQYLGLERGLTYWAESKGIDVTYWTDEDMDTYGVQLPQRTSALWLPAHDEYYSYPMRAALVQAMNAGVHVANLGANTVYREIDYSDDHRTWSIDRSALDASTRWRYRGEGWHEQTLLGAQYGCAPRGALTTNSSWLWAGVPAGTVLDGFVNGENDYVQAGIFTPPGQQVLSTTPARCYKNGTLQRVDVVSHVRASGARVINGSTFTYGCFVVQQCPSQWLNSTDRPLVVTDAQAAAVSKALGNIAAWQGIEATVSLDIAVAEPKDNLTSTRIETNEK